MGRVSLTEDYDDRSVIAKLNEMDKRVTENTVVVTSAEASAQASAAAAQETADRFAGSVGAVVQNANAQINASKAQVDQAKAEVDETVTTVAQAVTTANNASASAQQSATTVAGYDARLTAVEDADTQNVKIDTPQDITGRKTIMENYPRLDFKSKLATDVGSGIRLLDTTDGSQKHYLYMYPDRIDIPTPSPGAPSSAAVNKKYVESTDGATNNLVHRSANEALDGIKSFKRAIIIDRDILPMDQTPSVQVAKDILSITTQGSDYPLFSNIHVYRESSGTNELSIDLVPTGWDGSFSKRIRLRITVDSNGVGHLSFYNGQRSVELA